MSNNPKKRPPSADKDREGPAKARKKTSRACNGCRERKIKCDGKRPACGSCVTYNIASECSYSQDQDHRRIAPKQYVKALEQRVKFLESVLAEKNIVPDGFNVGVDLGDDGGSTDGEGSTDGGSVGDPNVAVSRLKIDDETGEPRQYGPTSVFMHMPEPSGPYLSSTPSNREPGEESSGYIYSLLHHASSQSPGTPEVKSPFPEFDWSKNLPYVEGMDAALHDELIALFFTYFNDWCCWVSSSLFIRDMVQCLRWDTEPHCRTSYYSPMLHNAILSMAANFCDDARLGTKDRGKLFAARAIERIGHEGERPMLSTVSALMLLGSYHSGNAKQTLGYMYAGMGLRTCQTLGLGIDCSGSSLISPCLKRERDRTFYMAYIQDKLWGAYVGRSASMILSDNETPLPVVEERRDKAPWIPVDRAKEMSTSDALKTDAFPPSWSSTCFLWTCKLAVLSERVTETVYSFHANLYSMRTQDVVSTLNLQLGEWYSNLPQGLVISPYSPKIPPPHVIMIHAMYHFVVILLHRPFYSGNPARKQMHLHDLSVSRCDSAAAQLVQMIELYRKCPGLRYAPISLTQMTFIAGTIHLLGAVSQENKRSEKRFRSALTGANDCVQALVEMGQTWQCGTQSGEVLENLIRDWCPSGSRDVPTPTSSGTATAVETPGQYTGSSEMTLHDSLSDPSSDLTKELIRLGWAPPSTNTQSQPRATGMPPNSVLSSNGFLTELPPSTFSTLDQLSVLRGTQYQPPPVQTGQVDSDVPDTSWNIDYQSASLEEANAWANLFGVENSFGWGYTYTHNWEGNPGQGFATQPPYSGQ
ncbi:hypothetical protein V5O48_010129 [Marasmius crinis-equi]|uniref:Zn(2)-C6 fungal-type domain-containing protein n=1 Tax=Marasmius crinis-equi TaxID=585013 RepID=A0ABR3F9S0_9AGAR